MANLSTSKRVGETDKEPAPRRARGDETTACARASAPTEPRPERRKAPGANMASLGCLNQLESQSPPLFLFGVGSIVLVVLNQVPQYRKILLARSADGLSAITVALGNVSSTFNVVNLAILHANQVPLCLSRSTSFLECQASFLVLYSALAGLLACFPVYFLKLYYHKRTHRTAGALVAGAYVQVLIVLCAIVPAFLSVMPWGDCEEYRDFANVLGFLNTIILCCQYLPQIYQTYRYKGSGAVSYVTLACDSLGGYTMVAYKIYATSERLSSWFPYLVFHTSELVVIAVALYFDRRKHRDRKLTASGISALHHGLESPRSDTSDRLLPG